MIDLHTHTDESDGTFSPKELIEEARRVGLKALAITDHDTFAGYDLAVPHAEQCGVELICGIEVSTKYSGHSIHLLGYFLRGVPSHEFRKWITALQTSRQRRNDALIQKLCSLGIRITLEDVAASGRKVIARPHFATVLVERGYAISRADAFERYLDEGGSCFVAREEPAFDEVIDQIHASDGLAVLPHPGRMNVACEQMGTIVREMCDLGLKGIEAYHSDHSQAQMDLYSSMSRKCGIAVTGGSDFHGATKPHIALGTGIGGNLNIPYAVLDELRQLR